MPVIHGYCVLYWENELGGKEKQGQKKSFGTFLEGVNDTYEFPTTKEAEEGEWEKKTLTGGSPQKRSHKMMSSGHCQRKNTFLGRVLQHERENNYANPGRRQARRGWLEVGENRFLSKSSAK